MNRTHTLLPIAFLAILFAAQTGFSAKRQPPPVRKFDAPDAPKFIRLDAKPGLNPPVAANGNYLIGPEYQQAPARKANPDVPQGKVQQFTIDSKTTKLLNPGIARKVFGTVDPKNPKTLIVDTHKIDYVRQITVYVPAQYRPGSKAPFIVMHDGPKGKPNLSIPRILDNLIAQKRIPAQIAIMIANGGGDAQGHQRGKEYDTMSGLFAEYIETEVLPLVEKKCHVQLTKNPDGRAVMGSSSGGSAALIMAWYRPDLDRRVLTTSGTFVNQQWPFDPKTPGGAWDFHDTLIPNTPRKPLRIFLAVGDRDSFNPNVMRDGMHDWVEANHRMAKVLKAKGYDYQYLFCQNSGHGIRNAKAQFLPHALEWVWHGYNAKQVNQPKPGSPHDPQASKPRVNNEKPGNRRQVKRVHPHALKLILQGKKKEAIAYLKETSAFQVNRGHTQLLLGIAHGKPNAWKYDAKTWPWKRALPNTSLKKDAPSDRFTIAFGGGAGYVPENERMWDTIGAIDPRALLLLGDNVYIDDPETPEMQRFHYYRRQSQPEWMKLASKVPIYGIWDDHDFTTNDGWGGPAIEKPKWKREVWKIFKENFDNPYYGGGEKQPGCWFDFWIGKVHFVLIDGRYYRESPRVNKDPSMLGPVQMKWLEQTLKQPAAFTVLCSNVPLAPKVKPGSKDTWDGYAAERQWIYEYIADQKIPGVIILSADRHRSDAYKTNTGAKGLYPIYEFSSSRLTNQHVHGLIKHSLFGYNEKQSFGRVDFDLKAADPTVKYTVINIDGKAIHSLTVKRSELQFK
jgi:enterochelin esterase-like enzyme